MAKVLCIGEILIDQIINQSGKQFEQTQAFHGGAPANVAHILAQLGTSSAFIGCVGGDPYGLELIEALKKIGVDVSGMQIQSQAPTRQVCVNLSDAGEGSFVGFLGGDENQIFADTLLTAATIPEKLFADADFLVLGTLGLASKATASAIERALALAEAHFVKVVVDINWRPIFWSNPELAPKIINDLLLRADFVKFTAAEAEWLYKTSSPRAIAQELDHLEGVIVTDGAKPCRYYLGENTGQKPAFAVKIVDSTGAGDGFLAGFLHRLCQISADQLTDPEVSGEIITYAAAVGAIVAMEMGAVSADNRLDHLQIQNFINSNFLRK